MLPCSRRVRLHCGIGNHVEGVSGALERLLQVWKSVLGTASSLVDATRECLMIKDGKCEAQATTLPKKKIVEMVNEKAMVINSLFAVSSNGSYYLLTGLSRRRNRHFKELHNPKMPLSELVKQLSMETR